MDLGRIMNVDPSGSQPWQHMRIGSVNENMSATVWASCAESLLYCVWGGT